jgi:hypothetical protein
MIPVMNFTRFKNFFLSFLIHYMIKKIDASRIEYKPSIEIFVWEYNNLIESKLKQLIKTN